jgi:HYDIN/CFA65/VesB family protein
MARYYPIVITSCAILALLLFWSTGIQSALFAPTPAEQSNGTPQLRLTETRRDVGQIASGQSAQASFRVHNDGPRRLILRKETGHCCGQGGPEEITLVPPGGSAPLNVEVETTGIQGGLQREIVYATNDPRMPQLRLTVVGRVE